MHKQLLLLSLFICTNNFSMHHIPPFDTLKKAAIPFIRPAIKTGIGLAFMDQNLRPLLSSLWQAYKNKHRTI